MHRAPQVSINANIPVWSYTIAPPGGQIWSFYISVKGETD